MPYSLPFNIIWFKKCFLLLVCLISTSIFSVHASDKLSVQVSDREDLLMSAFVYKVAKFVIWPQLQKPSSADNHFDLCVVDNPAFAQSFTQAVKNRLIAKLKIHVINISLESDLRHCHLLFFPDDHSEQATLYLNKALGKSILTIGTSVNFIKQGGMILLDRNDNKIRLIINNDRAKIEGLNISSHLLRLNKAK